MARLSRRRADYPSFDFDAAEVFVDAPIAPVIGLASDAQPPPAPETLSVHTRTLVVDTDGPAPTLMAHGIGDVKMGQAFLDADRSAGARRLGLPIDEPCETVMAGGVGDVNTGQYTLVGSEAPAAVGDKPPYRIPFMAEIAALPWNGLSVVSTFSGCGGSCLGFKMAGYRVLWANEFVPAAQDTYRANHAGTHLDTSDIRTVTAASIRAVIGDVEIDVLEGSPPCASFSTAGKTSKGWGEVRKYSDVEQRTDDLFGEYVRLVDGLKPRAFVAENVAGMVKGVSKGHYQRYLDQFRALPYNVEAMLLDAQHLGVPQRRVRLIFVGVRKDVGRPAWPKKLAYRYSIREAIPWLGKAAASAHGPTDWQKPEDRMSAESPAPTVPSRPEKGSYSGHCVTDDVRIEGSHGFDGHASRSIDEPAETITQRALNLDVRVFGGAADQAFGKEPKEYSINDPAPTIMAKGGRYSGGTDQFVVVVSGSAPSGQRGEADPDAPAPTIVGGNGGGKCQLFVEHVSGRRISMDGPMETLRATAGCDQQGYYVPSRAVEPESALGPAVGAEWDKLKPGEQSDKYMSLILPADAEPCPTVTAVGGTGAASVAHPYERRKFTIAELRRICGFPDDFILTGTYARQWERLGRAVPPPMMRAVAAALVPVLSRKDG